MKKFLAALCSLCFLLSGCGDPKPAESVHKPLLLVSLAPYKTLVQQLAGDVFEVQAIVPLHADPHNYEPTSKQLTQLANGRIWFMLGESFESKLMRLLQAKPVDLRLGMAMITEGGCHCHGPASQDRHIWLSPTMLAAQATAISAELSAQFPEFTDMFNQHLLVVQQHLTELDRQIAQKIALTTNRSFIVSHPAFAYFCRDYQCQQLSVEHEGKEPRPKEVEKLMATALSQMAKIAISLPQHNNKGAQLIASKLEIPVRMLDPYAADYSATMLQLASFIANPYCVHE